jgi:hypothetical protein
MRCGVHVGEALAVDNPVANRLRHSLDQQPALLTDRAQPLHGSAAKPAEAERVRRRLALDDDALWWVVQCRSSLAGRGSTGEPISMISSSSRGDLGTFTKTCVMPDGGVPTP